MEMPKKWLELWPETQEVIQRAILHESTQISQNGGMCEKWCNHVVQLYADYVGICRNLTLLVNNPTCQEQMPQTLLQLLDSVTRRWLFWHNELQIVNTIAPGNIDSTLIAHKLIPNNFHLQLPGATQSGNQGVGRLARDILCEEILGAATQEQRNVDAGKLQHKEVAKEIPIDEELVTKFQQIVNALNEYAERIGPKAEEFLKYPLKLSQEESQFAPRILLQSPFAEKKKESVLKSLNQDRPPLLCELIEKPKTPKSIKKTKKTKKKKVVEPPKLPTSKKQPPKKEEEEIVKNPIVDNLQNLLEMCKNFEMVSNAPLRVLGKSPASQQKNPTEEELSELRQWCKFGLEQGIISYRQQDENLQSFVLESFTTEVLIKNQLRFLQFSLCNWVDFATPTPLCIVGEPGTGKRQLIERFGAETNSVIINLTLLLVDHKKGKVEEFLSFLFKIAKFLQPTILLLDNMHTVLPVKKLGKKMDTLMRQMMKRLTKEINNGARILLVGLTDEPWRVKRIRSTFSTTIYLPPADYSTHFFVWLALQGMPEYYQEYLRAVMVSPLTWATRDLSIATVIEVVAQSYVAERSLRSSTEASQFVLHLAQAVKNLITRNGVQYVVSALKRKKMKAWIVAGAIGGGKRKGSRKSKKIANRRRN
ncbi:uncharacterized protein LOC129796675 [Lutzomyia longipalpis]|uniref:uncharacterized protein LOC129796675 n=1 Tax=Lutzomyia longipalpis TaxID=7200 RepID=UPI0024840BE5|nr:uncharacterized protein LOC129796675 [Lutzomyia longipalpis]